MRRAVGTGAAERMAHVEVDRGGCGGRVVSLTMRAKSVDQVRARRGRRLSRVVEVRRVRRVWVRSGRRVRKEMTSGVRQVGRVGV